MMKRLILFGILSMLIFGCGDLTKVEVKKTFDLEYELSPSDFSTVSGVPAPSSGTVEREEVVDIEKKIKEAEGVSPDQIESVTIRSLSLKTSPKGALENNSDQSSPLLFDIDSNGKDISEGGALFEDLRKSKKIPLPLQNKSYLENQVEALEKMPIKVEIKYPDGTVVNETVTLEVFVESTIEGNL